MRALPRLERNDKGADVKRLQGLLVANATSRRTPPSPMEPSTANSVMRPNAGQELTGSKVVDGAQWKKLLGV